MSIVEYLQTCKDPADVLFAFYTLFLILLSMGCLFLLTTTKGNVMRWCWHQSLREGFQWFIKSDVLWFHVRIGLSNLKTERRVKQSYVASPIQIIIEWKFKRNNFVIRLNVYKADPCRKLRRSTEWIPVWRLILTTAFLIQTWKCFSRAKVIHISLKPQKNIYQNAHLTFSINIRNASCIQISGVRQITYW